MKSLLSSLALALLLAGCATSYGPNGLTGGYKEDQIDDHTYAVYFYGNGHTSGDRVWNYWIYRCAELTKQKGYTAFALSPIDNKKTSQSAPQFRYSAAQNDGSDAPRFTKTKGSGGAGYYYTPGQTYTVYTGKAIVTMFKQPYPADLPFLLNADKILEVLKPFVDSEGKAEVPPRKEILEKSQVPRTTSI